MEQGPRDGDWTTSHLETARLRLQLLFLLSVRQYRPGRYVSLLHFVLENRGRETL